MKEFRRLGPEGIANELPQNVSCYVSIDIDVLDISLVPGCVSAEPNGLTYSELAETLKTIANNNKIVGVDLVEVAPNLDVGAGITSYLAAHIIVEFLGQIFE